ncbi:MAG: hypothetical protein JOZ90_13035 [Alphaproteobacteria bacterium]|nr:hypothetical protein [Alphaproteobacteria bacterium]MBV9370345.1 hypothetical protein [Alphaproteobacteria bacterium]MBV9901998.1 hypothetical protein [Alphaproteobacteria bacterium]
MAFSRLFLLGLALGAAAPGCAAGAAPLPKLAGTTVLAGCRQGECRWLRIAAVDRVASVRQGELRRIRVREGSSFHPDGDTPTRAAAARIAWQKGERAEYAFCSTARPAYAFPGDGGRLLIHYLDLFDLGGYQYASAGLYMRLCHGRDGLPPARVLRALGYRSGTRSEQVEARGPEAMTRF